LRIQADGDGRAPRAFDDDEKDIVENYTPGGPQQTLAEHLDDV
jgi:hypothetical protein